MNEGYTLAELCRALGKPALTVRTLQQRFRLHCFEDPQRYPAAYLCFLEGVVALRTCGVPLDQIVDLFELEVRILKMTHADALSSSPCWYLEHCHPDRRSESQLLLTGYDLGFPLTAGAVQVNLNFRPAPEELFRGPEMGECISRVLETYRSRLERVCKRVRSELPVLKNSLLWSERAFRREWMQ